MMFDTRVPVVVATHLGGNGYLGIARTLGRVGVPVYLGIDAREPTPISRSRYWARVFRWDFSRPEDESVEFLLGVGRQLENAHGAKPIVLTTSDWMAVFLERFGDVLEAGLIVPRAKEPIIRRLGDKSEMASLARLHGIPTPETLRPRSRDDVVAFAESATFPVVVKPADPYAPATPSKEIVQTPDDLLRKLEREGEPATLNAILQEYIPGEARDVWMCNSYLDAESRCLAVFSGRKLRQVSSTGIASLAVVEPNPTVESQTTSFLQAVGYTGCSGVGWRFDHRDGLYKLLDINPRVSGVFRLFRATNGMDVVRVCHLDLTGQEVPATAASVGRKWMIESDLRVAMAGLRNGDLTIGQWLSSVRGVRETQWFALDDPLPFLAWVGSGIGRRVPALGVSSERARRTRTPR